MPRRRKGSGHDGVYAAIAASLPGELRSFEGWLYGDGLGDFILTLSGHVGADDLVSPVMGAAGLSAAAWFRAMLEAGQ